MIGFISHKAVVHAQANSINEIINDSNSNITISMLVMCSLIKRWFLFRYILILSLLFAVEVLIWGEKKLNVKVWRKQIPRLGLVCKSRIWECFIYCILYRFHHINMGDMMVDGKGIEPIKLKFKTTKSHWKALNLNHICTVRQKWKHFQLLLVFHILYSICMYICFNGLEFCFKPFYDKIVNQTSIGIVIAIRYTYASPMRGTSAYMLSNHTNNNKITLSIQYYQIIATYSIFTQSIRARTYSCIIYIAIIITIVINTFHNVNKDEKQFSSKFKSDL